jgi:hypothetical protein
MLFNGESLLLKKSLGILFNGESLLQKMFLVMARNRFLVSATWTDTIYVI